MWNLLFGTNRHKNLKNIFQRDALKVKGLGCIDGGVAYTDGGAECTTLMNSAIAVALDDIVEIPAFLFAQMLSGITQGDD
jgi:hypothetical protein